MMKKCILFMSLLVVSVVTQEQQGQPISEFIKVAQANITDLAESIKSHLNIPDQQTLVDTFKNQSTTLVNNLQQYIGQVSQDVKSKTPELEKLWVDVKTKLDKVIEDFNASVPNAKESAEQLQKQFQEGVQTLVKESNTIAESIKQNSGTVKEEIATFTKKAVDIAVEATQNLNNQLKNAAEKKN